MFQHLARGGRAVIITVNIMVPWCRAERMCPSVVFIALMFRQLRGSVMPTVSCAGYGPEAFCATVASFGVVRAELRSERPCLLALLPGLPIPELAVIVMEFKRLIRS